MQRRDFSYTEFLRAELIGGELIPKAVKKPPHVHCLWRLRHWAANSFGADFINTQCPMDVSPEDNCTNEPEPDLIVLTRSTFEITENNPKPSEIRLVVEIAVSTDLKTKAALYARAGIREFWIVDINERLLIVHRDPQPSGKFKYVMSFTEGETAVLSSEPPAELLVGDLF